MSQWISELNTWVYGVVSGLIAGIIWLIRKVITNERQVELLKQEITLREETRKETEQEIKEHLSELRSDIKGLLNRK
jgi:hypothetical protein